jgi:hypothetical protein
MTDSLLLPLLTLLADGREHNYIDLEIELRKSFPLSLTIRTEGTLDAMGDEGMVYEDGWSRRYTITQDGITKLAELREAALKPVVKPRKQGALFA